ncbi:MAG: DUF6263 family protein [Phycisphaerales bacterium]
MPRGFGQRVVGVARVARVAGAAAWVGVAVATAGVARAQSPDQSVEMRYSWPVGASLTYDNRAEVLTEAESRRETASSVITTFATQELEVASERRGSGELDVATTVVRVDGDLGAAGRIRFDSESASDRRRAREDLIAPFAFLLGERYSIRLSPVGEVERIEGYAELLDQMLRGLRDRGVRETMRSTMNEDVFRANLEQQWHVVPDGEVEVGDTWTVRRSQDISGVGRLTLQMRYTLERVQSVDGQRVGIVSATGDAWVSGGQARGVELDITDARIDGQAVFAVDAGVLLSVEQNTFLRMEVRAGGQFISQTMDMSSRVWLTGADGYDLPSGLVDPSRRDRAVSAGGGAGRPSGKR